MRHVSSSRNLPPSASLLKFLRSQQERVCFFSPSSTPSKAVAPWNDWHPRSTSREVPVRATVDASYLDALRPSHRKIAPKFLPCTSETRLQPRRSALCVQQHSRHASTDSQSFLRRIFSFPQRHIRGKLHPSDLPPGQNFEDPSSQLFNLSRSLSRSTSRRLETTMHRIQCQWLSHPCVR